MPTHDRPVDTRMMGIVHGALLRDLARVQDVLSAPAPPRGPQRTAVAGHVVWMMDFLHAHHTTEDEGLWPLLLARDPDAAALVASLEADHAGIAPAAQAATVAATAYETTTDDPPRAALLDAVTGLLEVLAPHLEREVAEAMPVVAASVTQAEWDDVERRFNLSTKSMRQLAIEGHWLLDGIDPEGRDVVVHLVPWLQRQVLLHGFARVYRSQSRARWSPVSPAPRALVR